MDVLYDLLFCPIHGILWPSISLLTSLDARSMLIWLSIFIGGKRDIQSDAR